ncbi:hypothetical protein HII31_02662 [Pseudocercospora fuligena]|uniref:Uncharacterized protein n=1 Tax=Pseudocercospora fuligena TaxID=685502 RepID=A0A8H6RPD2_9PEZI|nr:hypothetical protein HII31_02662 [Pseudocercospora fuligena]
MLSGGSNWDDLIARPTTDGADELMYTYGGGEQHTLRGDYVSDLLARPVDAAPAQHNGLRPSADGSTSIFRHPTTGAATPALNMRAIGQPAQAFDFNDQMRALREKIQALTQPTHTWLPDQARIADFGQASARVQAAQMEPSAPPPPTSNKPTVKRERAPSPESQLSDGDCRDDDDYEPQLFDAAAPAPAPEKPLTHGRDFTKQELGRVLLWRQNFLAADRAQRGELFQRHPPAFPKTGRLMFLYHAVADILDEEQLRAFEKDTSTLAAAHMTQLVSAWPKLPKKQKRTWKEATKQFKKFFRKKNLKMLQYLDLVGTMPMRERHSQMVKQTAKPNEGPQADDDELAASSNAGKASLERPQSIQDVQVKTEPPEHPDPVALPILQHFALDEGWDVYPKEMAQLTLEYIDIFLADAPGMITRVRWDNTLIDYDPKVQTPYGVWTRLSTGLSNDRWPSFCYGKVETRAAKVESLLLPFFCINRCDPKFDELVESNGKYFDTQGGGYATRFGPATAWLGDRLTRHKRDKPFNHLDVADSVMHALRRRVVSEQFGLPAGRIAYQDGEPSLRDAANIAVEHAAGKVDESFSIAGNDWGFGETLIHCFWTHELQAHEWEDYLEQELYRFDRHTNGQFQLQQSPLAGPIAETSASDPDVQSTHLSAKRPLEQEHEATKSTKRVKQDFSRRNDSSVTPPPSSRSSNFH